MEAKELRIGNYVRCKIKLQLPVDEYIVDGQDIGLFETYTLMNFDPIPLTKNWLTRFGFTYDRNNEKFVIDVLGSTLYLRKAVQGGFFWGLSDDLEEHIELELLNVRPLKYVHQLQNFYFAITDGEELTIKDTDQ